MRCKNCGSENDDNRYICENCGSPLYDENDFDNLPEDNTNQTQSFDRVGEHEELDLGVTPETAPDNGAASQGKGSEKKSIIVIAILAVVLIAIIASVIVVAKTKSANENETTESTSVSTTVSTTKEKTTKETTTKETTTAPTTTEATTKEEKYSIKLVSKGGGTVSGAGTYKEGENVTIVATPDDGYQFDGWYSDGSKISNTQKFSFTATENTSISAVFSAVTTTAAPDNNEELNGGID